MFQFNPDRFCLRPISSRSKFAAVAGHRCFRLAGHFGRCDEYPYLRHLAKDHKRIMEKIRRDATNTTGAAWKSADAGPNRILRWAMLLSDEELLRFGIDMAELRPEIIAKLREKAAPYEDCMAVSMKLTWLVYQMPNAPEPPTGIKEYLEWLFGPMQPESMKCMICRRPIDFGLFSDARRGKAEIETCHKDPRVHSVENVGFAHRDCNIAQGAKTLDAFYAWIAAILERIGQ